MINNQIKQIQSLKKTKFRKLYGQFFIEGIRLVKAAIDWSSSVKEIYCTKQFYHLKNSRSLFSDIDKNQIILLSEVQFKKICSTKSPSGIAAVCMIPKQNGVNLKEDKWLYLDRISDPGNLGTILRSASWFGLKHIALSSNSVDPYNSKTVRAGMGAHFGINLYRDIDLHQFSKTHNIIAADKEGLDIGKYNFPKKSVFVFGNEAHGISDENKEAVQQSITIKGQGVGESLNVAAAASIIMHTVSKNK